MAEPLTSPEELFAGRLRQMLWIELELAERVLPELMESAHASELTYAFERHLLETEQHVEAVRRILAELAVHAEPEPSPALQGLVKEHEQLVSRIPDADRALLDLAHAQSAAATEHLEIAAYHALASTAEALGREEIGIALRDLEEQEQHALEVVERGMTIVLAEKVESPRS
jgi:ferritin-like metal-binding protein YciE